MHARCNSAAIRQSGLDRKIFSHLTCKIAAVPEQENVEIPATEQKHKD